MEPLLGPVDLTATEVSCGADVLSPGPRESGRDVQSGRHLSRIHAVIVGGESGPGARPMHPAWVRSLRDQCERADIPFLFKQWGEWSPSVLVEGETAPAKPQQGGERWTFRDGQLMRRVGKKAAGRVLDGVVHDEFGREPLLLGEV